MVKKSGRMVIIRGANSKKPPTRLFRYQPGLPSTSHNKCRLLGINHRKRFDSNNQLDGLVDILVAQAVALLFIGSGPICDLWWGGTGREVFWVTVVSTFGGA